jgi:hypothetical protein
VHIVLNFQNFKEKNKRKVKVPMDPHCIRRNKKTIGQCHQDLRDRAGAVAQWWNVCLACERLWVPSLVLKKKDLRGT